MNHLIRLIPPMLILILLTIQIGCSPSASIAWSPDGKRGVYAVQTLTAQGDLLSSASLIDIDGKIIADLGPITACGTLFGGQVPAAWSVDSTSFYYIAENPGGDAIPEAADWQSSAAKWAASFASPLPETKSVIRIPFASLFRWQNGKARAILPLGKRLVMDLQLSGDGKWITILTVPEGRIQNPFELYAFNPEHDRLYLLSRHSGMGVCFTGDNRLAFIEGSSDENKATGRAQIVEVTLNDQQPAPHRTAIAEVLTDAAGWLRADATGFFFLARPENFPAKSNDRPDAERFIGSLYHWNRESGELRELTKSVAAIAISPDSKRVIYLTSTPEEKNEVKALTLNLMDADGTHAHALGDPALANLAIWPAWHGNDRITRADGPGTEAINRDLGGKRTIFNLVESQLSAEGTVQSTRNLSDGWSDEMKPFWFDRKLFNDIH